MSLTEEEEDELKRLQLAKLRREDADLRKRQEAVARRAKRRHMASEAWEKLWELIGRVVGFCLFLLLCAAVYTLVAWLVVQFFVLIDWIF